VLPVARGSQPRGAAYEAATVREPAPHTSLTALVKELTATQTEQRFDPMLLHFRERQRSEHQAIYDAANNRMIVFGGSDDVQNFDDFWVLTKANGLVALQPGPKSLQRAARQKDQSHSEWSREFARVPHQPLSGL